MRVSRAKLMWAVALSVIPLWIQLAGASVLEVPSDHPSINAAIAAAVDGDTVRVAPGVYVENLDFLGKAILVTSHFLAGEDWEIVERTVLDGGSPDNPAAASTVTFRSGEGRDAVLQGFTVTGGRGTEWVDPQFPGYTWRGGGGIFSFRSSPTIRYTVVSGNRVENSGDVDGAQGGGILAYGGNPVIRNSIITLNEAEYGGGLVVDYSGATVANTAISRNSGGRSYGGGGIWTIGNGDAPIVLSNCVILDNVSPTRGGAMYLWSSEITVRNSIIWGNAQAEGDPVHGHSGGRASISHSLVEGGFGGDGNIDADPAFANPVTCLLDRSSPCVDAGHPAAQHHDPEHPAAEGRARWPAHGGLRNDMGLYGGPDCTAMGACSAPRSGHGGREAESPTEIPAH